MKLLTTQVFYTLIFCLGITIIFVTLYRQIKKGSGLSREALHSFIRDDHEANFITKKSPPTDLLLPPNLECIPKYDCSRCEASFNLVQKLATQPMARLGAYTNIELKKTFGINHLETLFTYEQHYFNFLKALTDYGIALHEANETSKSIEVLEYCLQFGCDLNKCYLYLIKNYGIIRDIEKLTSLKKYLEVQRPLGKEMVERTLDEMLQSIKNQ